MPYCPACGAAVPDGALFCPGCATPQQGVTHASNPRTEVANPTVAFSDVLRRLGRGDIVAGAATVVVFIALFLPWYSVSLLTGVPQITNSNGMRSVLQGTTFSTSVSALGTGAGGWRFLVLLVSLAVLAYLGMRVLLPSPPRLPYAHWQVLAAGAGLNGLLVLLAFLVKPGAATVACPGCGVAVSVANRFCTSCGVPLGG